MTYCFVKLLNMLFVVLNGINPSTPKPQKSCLKSKNQTIKFKASIICKNVWIYIQQITFAIFQYIRTNYLFSWPLFWVPFKLQLVIVKPILEPLSFSHEFSILVCIVDCLNKYKHAIVK